METMKIVETVTRNLPTKLNQHELRDRGDQLAAVIQDLKAEEDRQTDAKAQMKARLAELDAKKTQLAITISRREEYRDQTCDVFHDCDRLLVEVIRRDTNEVVTSRGMTEHERQQLLPV